jgi:hypothetical protein
MNTSLKLRLSPLGSIALACMVFLGGGILSAQAQTTPEAASGDKPEVIKTVRNVGYDYVPPLA